jgi:hypothetical protein
MPNPRQPRRAVFTIKTSGRGAILGRLLAVKPYRKALSIAWLSPLFALALLPYIKCIGSFIDKYIVSVIEDIILVIAENYVIGPAVSWRDWISGGAL